MSAILMSIWLLVAPYVQVPHWPLSLTPITQERVVHEDIRIICPRSSQPISLQGAPLSCVMASLDRQSRQIERTLRRLQKQMEQPHRP